MAGIGGVTCTFVKGNCAAMKQRSEVWQQPGVDGYGIHLLGGGDSPARFVGVYYASLANVEAWLYLIESLQGTLITVVDDHGITHPVNKGRAAIFVQRVSVGRKTTAVDPGGSFAIRGEVMIEGIVV